MPMPVGWRKFHKLEDVFQHIYANTRPEGGCLVWTGGKGRRGYPGPVRFRGKAKEAHRWVAEYFLGPCPPDMEVRHMCGRGHHGCVTASHMVYGTHQQNMVDASRHWANKARQFTVEQVQYIRQEYSAGKQSLGELGRRFGVTKQAISAIVKRINYGWIPSR